jgi:hypothetical protein
VAMKVKLFLFGASTYIMGSQFGLKGKGTGGTNTARYCYSVWLRHLAMAHRNHVLNGLDTVAELGPGDSIGIGLAALISGAEKYYALDVVEFANIQRNLAIFEELVLMFKRQEDIPGEDEFPNVKPKIDDYGFPHDILTHDRLKVALDDSRLELIRKSIKSENGKDSKIEYIVPWYNSCILKKESVDMIYSQAVLEHVDDLINTYRTLSSWLKPKGFMSHQIDFKCHGTAKEWNGHWKYSDFAWKIIRGKRPYLLNREPHSTHIRLLKEAGFDITCDIKVMSRSKIDKRSLAKRFQKLLEDDLTTSGAFILASKK